mmetsp:Transcript_73126/g.189902  ORF Transcript_73126/g.189902 Transcript_73126/m.189902 type:complete len:234 (-) Transcript_73126:359-1060(-)
MAMFLMSRPRAATSVAQSTLASPLRNLFKAVSLRLWSKSPWISSVHRPNALSSFSSQARSLQFCFVFENTKQFAPSESRPKMRFNAAFLSSLLLQTSTFWVMFLFVVISSEPIWICTGSLIYFFAKSRHSLGQVAVNMLICFSHGTLSSISLICGSKPMSSMRSASSRTAKRTWSRITTLLLQKSFNRPGVAMRQSGPSLIFHSWSLFGAPPYAHAAVICTGLPNFSASLKIW